MRILLVEDDVMIGEAIGFALRESSYAVDWVVDGNAALHAVAGHQYDLILLDLGLPKQDGITVLTTIRQQQNDVPVLIISARDGLDDRITGLDLGADDYVLKPFEMAELHARMRAVLRRKTGTATPVISNGVLTLNPANRCVWLQDADPIQLSNREYALLHALMVRSGAILSRAQLEERIYGWGDEVDSNAVEFLIHSLRKKLGTTSIKNVRGAGWMVAKQH